VQNLILDVYRSKEINVQLTKLALEDQTFIGLISGRTQQLELFTFDNLKEDVWIMHAETYFKHIFEEILNKAHNSSP
jgi:hypothetical protein